MHSTEVCAHGAEIYGHLVSRLTDAFAEIYGQCHCFLKTPESELWFRFSRDAVYSEGIAASEQKIFGQFGEKSAA